MVEGTPRFVIYRDAIGEWRFRFMCSLAVQRLRSSEGYNARASVEKAVESVRRNAVEPESFVQKVNTRGNHFFTLQARNGDILAVSRVLDDVDDLDDDRIVCQLQAPSATVVQE